MGKPRHDLPTALEAFATRNSRTRESVERARAHIHALEARLSTIDLDVARFVMSAHDFFTADDIEAREIAWADCQELADRLATNLRTISDPVEIDRDAITERLHDGG